MITFVQRILHRIRFHYRHPRSRTVRYAFPVLFTTVSLLGAALILPDDASYVRISTSDRSVAIDQEFSVDVYVGAHVPVNAVNIALKFPTDLVEVESINFGRSVITIWTQEPYVEDDAIIFSGGTFRRGFLGEHLIGTVDFKTLKVGEAEFRAGDIEFFAGDGSGASVSVEDAGEEEVIVLVKTLDELVGEALVVITRTDIDNDGQVSMADIIEFMRAWRERDVTFDFNGDNKMSFRDFGIILADSFNK